MKMLSVHIENNSSTSITVKGRNGIKIPAHATGAAAVTISLPDTPQVAKTLNRLRREYPILRIEVNKVEGGTEPFKVRGAKDEASAVEQAYETYLEDFTSPAKG